MNRRKIIGTLAGIAISCLFLFLTIYRVDVNAIGTALRSANYGLVALSAVFTFLSYVFRTARWARLLQPRKKIPIVRLYPILIIGFALNNLFPGRPGELARAFALGQRESLPKTLGLATVIVERVADGITLIFILAFLSLGFELPGWGQQVEEISLGILVIVLGGLLVLLWREPFAIRSLNRLVHFLPANLGRRAGEMLSSFILGLHSLRSPKDVIVIALLSLCAWCSEAIHYFVVLTAFGLRGSPGTRAIAGAFTMVMINLGISIPAAPGGVGPFEAAGVLALGAFGLPRESALPVVLVSHALQFILISGLGIFFVAQQGIRLTQVVEEEQLADGFLHDAPRN